MSHSPRNEQDPDQIFQYRRAWAAINTMLEQGRSLSGHERHCAFLNTRGQRFADVSAVSGLDLDDDGRGVALSDWNHDGRIDLWTTNRTGPSVRLLENRSTTSHGYLAVQLEGVKCNRDAIGARLALRLSGETPLTLYKSLRAGEGFVSQSSKRIIFGLGDSTEIDRLLIHWPDGDVQAITGLRANSHYRIVQGQAQPIQWNPPPPVTLPEPPELKEPAVVARVVFSNRVPLPEIRYRPLDGDDLLSAVQGERPTLINIWASWCAPCLSELKEWKAKAAELNDVIDVVTLNVEGLADDGGSSEDKVKQTVENLELPFAKGLATKEGIATLEVAINALVDKPQPLVVPLSILVDRDGRLAVIYRGRIGVEQILGDVANLSGTPEAHRDLAAHFAGVWFDEPPATDPSVLLRGLIAAGKLDTAEDYLQQWMRRGQQAKQPVIEACYAVADAHRARGDLESAMKLFRQALDIDPDQTRVNLDLGVCLMKLGRPAEAVAHLEKALKGDPGNTDTRKRLVLALSRAGRFADMQHHAQKLLDVDQHDVIARLHLAFALKKQKQYAIALEHYQTAIGQQPELLIAQNDIAWFLATCPAEDVRDGSRAVEFANKACQATGFAHPAILDTLAAAQAETGDFDGAIATLEKALRLAQTSGDERLQAVLQEHIALYRQQTPLRDD